MHSKFIFNNDLIFIKYFQFILDDNENLLVDPQLVDENNMHSKFTVEKYVFICTLHSLNIFIIIYTFLN